MRFYSIDGRPLAGYVGQDEELGYMAEEPDELGYIYDDGDLEGLGYYGGNDSELGAEDELGYVMADDLEDDPEEVGYFADPPPGFTEGCPSGIAYVAQDPDYGEMGYFGDEEGLEDAQELYEVPDELGFVGQEDEEFGCIADDYDELGEDDLDGFAADPEGIEGYVRQAQPSFNTRVMPLDTVNGVEGYQRPKTVNPTCEKMRPAEETGRPASRWFQPLW